MLCRTPPFVPPRAESRRQIKYPILRDKGVEYIRHELHDRGTLRIVARERETELENGIAVVTWWTHPLAGRWVRLKVHAP